jgi:hypothetical protein
MPNPDRTPCACMNPDAYDCWCLSHFQPPETPATEIDAASGPCPCSCHDDSDDDIPEEAFLYALH